MLIYSLKVILVIRSIDHFTVFYFRYQKLKKGRSEDDSMESFKTNVAAKYVILEEMDELNDGS
jgi:hypothetical protein